MSQQLTTAELDGIRDVLERAGTAVTGDLRAALIAGGRSNLTFRLADDHCEWVLRTPPHAGRTPSAHDVAREFTVTHALAQAAFPVPPAVVLHEDDSILGGPFAITEFVRGSTIRSRDDLDSMGDEQVRDIVSALMETFAELHSIDYRAIGLERFGRPDGYAERQVRRWSGQWDVVAPADPHVRAAGIELAARLQKTVPGQQRTSIVHGDYRIDNTLLSLNGKPQVAAVVDWELSTIGDPAADVAMMCAYRHPALDQVLGFPAAWTSDRLPSTSALADAYANASGHDLSDWNFHLALAHYKIAVISAGIDHRSRASAHGDDPAGLAVLPFLEAGLASLGGDDHALQ